ncbi:unnamed protein product, partial [Amoebophrya sp. A25]
DDRDDVSIVRSAHLGVHPLLTKDDVSAMVHAIIRLPKGVRPIDILISNSVSVVWRQDCQKKMFEDRRDILDEDFPAILRRIARFYGMRQ